MNVPQLSLYITRGYDYFGPQFVTLNRFENVFQVLRRSVGIVGKRLPRCVQCVYKSVFEEAWKCTENSTFVVTRFESHECRSGALNALLVQLYLLIAFVVVVMVC